MGRPVISASIVRLPAKIQSGIGVRVTRTGGKDTIAQDWSAIQQPVVPPAVGALELLYRNPTSGEYFRAPAAEALAGAGILSPLTYKAKGDGTTDDLDEWRTTEAVTGSIFLPSNTVFNIGTNLPVKPIFGPGAVKANAVTVGSVQPTFDAINSNVIYAPPVYAHLVGSADYNGLPPNNATEAHYNVVIAPGFREGLSTFPSNNKIRRSTFVGVEIGKYLEEAERVEAIGNASLKFARFAERCTMVGTLTGQWAGQDLTTDPANQYFFQDLFWGNGTPITDPAWDPFGIYTARPAVKVELEAFTAWATSKDDFSFNVVVGRDAGVEMVKGKYNTFSGYRANGLAFSNEYNAVHGANALFMNLWGNGNTADGYGAGYYHQTGDYNVYSGFFAGATQVTGNGNVFVGVNAGGSYDIANSAYVMTSANWAVLIGQDAGRKADGTTPAILDNRFYLQDRYTRSPLLSGEFALGRLAVNRPITDADGIRGTLHLYSGDSGSTAGASLSATELVLEAAGNCGVTMLGTGTTARSIFFGRPGAEAANYLQFKSDTTVGSQYFRVAVGDAERFRVDGAGNLMLGRTSASGAANAPGWVMAAGGFAYSARSGTAAQGHINFYNNAAATVALIGSIYTSGSTLSLRDSAANDRFAINSTGIGFFGTAPVAKPSITGSRGGNAALADLLTKLAATGLLADTTTA